MTHPPTAPPAFPPVSAAGAAPPRPPQAPTGAPPVPQRGTALAEGAAQLRAGARTEPGKLRIIGAVITGLLLLFGAVTFLEVAARADAADTVRSSSQPLSARAAEIYRSLADANTTAAAGFLAGENEDPAVRRRYEEDIDRAARLLADAAAHSSGSEEAQSHIAVLNEELPYYTGLVETARANNRQELPLGGAYLRYADQRMQDTLLDAAEGLYALETERFQKDMDEARAWPWFSTATGLLALAVLGWAQRRHYLRTNRVFDRGLLAATGAATVLLLWLAGAHGMAHSSLNEAEHDAAHSLSALNGAWTEALKARGDENISLVARGTGDESEQSYQAHMDGLAGPAGSQDGSLLWEARELADDEEGRDPVLRAIEATEEWRERHTTARDLELAGQYEAALNRVIGPQNTSGESFDLVNESLAEAVRHEQEEFTRAADSGQGALGGLRPGAVTLALLAALGALFGFGGRLSEYR